MWHGLEVSMHVFHQQMVELLDAVTTFLQLHWPLSMHFILSMEHHSWRCPSSKCWRPQLGRHLAVAVSITFAPCMARVQQSSGFWYYVDPSLQCVISIVITPPGVDLVQEDLPIAPAFPICCKA